METLSIIVYVVGSILIFLGLREFFCWYFKINERITLLKNISKKLGPDIEVEKKKNE